MASKIIDTSKNPIVVEETPIHLTDEKLRNVLSHTYERAQEDMNIPKLRKHYGSFLSIAGTLFLTLLTSNFKTIGIFSADLVNGIASVLCFLCAVFGFALLGMNVSDRMKQSSMERDKAVDEMIKQYLFDRTSDSCQ